MDTHARQHVLDELRIVKARIDQAISDLEQRPTVPTASTLAVVNELKDSAIISLPKLTRQELESLRTLVDEQSDRKLPAAGTPG